MDMCYSDLNADEIIGTFYEIEFGVEKVIKKKDDKLYIK